MADSRRQRYYNEAKGITSRAATRAGGYYSANVNAVLKGLLVIGGLAIGGYGVYRVVQSLAGPPGGACNDPTSPCYTATQPYVQQINSCTNQYNSYLAQFIAQDAAAGTSFTQLQLDTLAQLRSCINQNAASLGQAAQQYIGGQSLNFMVYSISTAVALGIGSYFGAKAVNVLRGFKVSAAPKTGSAAADLMNNTGIAASVDNGVVTSASASAFASDAQGYSAAFEAENAGILEDTYTALDILSVEAAAADAELDSVYFADDLTSVLDILSGAFAYSPLAAYSGPAPLFDTVQGCGCG
jgi:hypothetical protein